MRYLSMFLPFLFIIGCGPSKMETQMQDFETRRVAAKAEDDKKRAEYRAKAKRLEAAADATMVSETALSTPEALQDYSRKVDTLFSL